MEQEELNKLEEEVKEEINQVEPEVASEVKTEEQAACDMVSEATDDKKCRCRHAHCIARLIFDLLMLAAVVTLFVLYAKGRSCHQKQTSGDAVAQTVTPGNGDVLYVNIDSVNEHYEMAKILTDSLQDDQNKKKVIFENRQKALETKLRNYQQNMQTGQLTAQQAQYAEASLQQENAQLQSDYEQAVSSFEARYTAALSQIQDSLIAASKRVNESHNASFIVTYGGGVSNIIIADPTKDITSEVLEVLNKPFKKKKK